MKKSSFFGERKMNFPTDQKKWVGEKNAFFQEFKFTGKNIR
jgi:hypothetical protein